MSVWKSAAGHRRCCCCALVMPGIRRRSVPRLRRYFGNSLALFFEGSSGTLDSFPEVETREKVEREGRKGVTWRERRGRDGKKVEKSGEKGENGDGRRGEE